MAMSTALALATAIWRLVNTSVGMGGHLLFPARPAPLQKLAYCGEYGRFSDQVIALFKMMWLAGSLDRTLVLPPELEGEPTLAMFDRAALAYYFSSSQSGAMVLPTETTTCAQLDTLYTMSMINRQLSFWVPSWQTNECTQACRFTGNITSLWAFDHPRLRSFNVTHTTTTFIKAVTANAPPAAAVDLARIPVLAMPPTAAFQMSVPMDEFPVLPFTVAIVESARVVLASLRPLDTSPATFFWTNQVVSMCVHLGWDLVRWKPTLEDVVTEIRTMAAQRGVTRLFVTTTANATADREYLTANLPGGTEMGCDPVKWPQHCQSSARQAVTEMAVCALTDLFLGSPFSTFTGLIAAQRERVHRKDPATGGLLSYVGPLPRSPPHFLSLTVYNDKYI